jgi:hypothetical protein
MKTNIAGIMRYFTNILIILSLTGCTSMKPIPLPSNNLNKETHLNKLIKIGDEIKVQTNSGKSYRFIVIKKTDTHLIGKRTNIAINSINSIEKVETDYGKTSVLLVAIGAAIAVAFAATVVNDTVNVLDE